jgi:hypothetical protein
VQGIRCALDYRLTQRQCFDPYRVSPQSQVFVRLFPLSGIAKAALKGCLLQVWYNRFPFGAGQGKQWLRIKARDSLFATSMSFNYPYAKTD